MISFPAAWLRLVFAFLCAILLFLALLHILNAFRHGSRLSLTALSTGIFVIGIAVIVWLAVNLLMPVDWSSTFSLSIPSVSFTHFGL